MTTELTVMRMQKAEQQVGQGKGIRGTLRENVRLSCGPATKKDSPLLV